MGHKELCWGLLSLGMADQPDGWPSRGGGKVDEPINDDFHRFNRDGRLHGRRS